MTNLNVTVDKSIKFATLYKRGIAQPGSARRSGRRSRRFKSGYPDQNQQFSWFFVLLGISSVVSLLL